MFSYFEVFLEVWRDVFARISKFLEGFGVNF